MRSPSRVAGFLAGLLAACSASGSPGTGGSGGVAGQAGAGGSAGSGGIGGAGGTGGSGGSGGAITAGTIVFVDFCAGGCTVLPGADDAVTFHSSIVNATTTLAEAPVPLATRADVLSCLRGLFSGLDVAFSDVDPGAFVPHRSILVTGPASALGLPAGTGGTAPFLCHDVPGSIAFAFADDFVGTRLLCEGMARQIAATFGLDHTFFCPDVMSFQTGCGDKTFSSHDSPCGEFASRDCCTGLPTQNSRALLQQVIGPVP